MVHGVINVMIGQWSYNEWVLEIACSTVARNLSLFTVCVGYARTVYIRHISHIFDEVPAKNTPYKPCKPYI